MYVQHGIEAYSRNNCCHEKSANIAYFSVFTRASVRVRAYVGARVQGVCIYAHACSLAYPAFEARVPYCHL
jgi:hypothetical protein